MTLALAAAGDRWRAPLQTGAAAALAWWIAGTVAGHARPLTAPVVAVISIGAATGGRWRRTLDVTIGVTIGFGLATVLVSTLGHGPFVLAFVVTVAMLTARAADGGELLVMQAGIAAVLVFATPQGGSASDALERVADALIGGASAGLVSLFLLPPDPVKLLTGRLDPLLAELAGIFEDIATALRSGDGDQAAAALDRARATTQLVDALHRTRPVAAEIARFVPLRRRALERTTRISSASVHVDHAVRNTRALARAALALLPAEQTVRDDCASAVETLGAAMGHLDAAHTSSESIDVAAHAAARLGALHADNPDPALGAVATASRGIADDLALACGIVEPVPSIGLAGTTESGHVAG